MESLDVRMPVDLHNFFVIECRDAESGELIERGYAENIVLNKFYSAMITTGDTGNGFNNIQIGSSSAAPDASQTGLQALIGTGSVTLTKSTTQYAVGGTGIITFTGSWVIAASSYVGQTFREVGIDAWTRALLQDANGNPLEIAKTDTMVVTIYATVYLTIPETISGFKFGLGATNWYYDDSVNFLNSFGSMVFSNCRKDRSWKEAADNSPISEGTATFTASWTADAANKLRNYTYGTIQASEANLSGGIRCVRINTLEIPLPNDLFTQSVIVKEVVGTGDGSTKEFNSVFGWVKNNGTLHVYVNDVETTDFTPMYNKPAKAAALTEMRRRNTLNGFTGVVENCSGRPILSFKNVNYNTALYVSNDGTNWTFLSNITYNTTYNIPLAYQNYKYWRDNGRTDDLSMASQVTWTFGGGDIVFNAAPSSGATVTMSYQPDCIAKNSDKLIKNIAYKIGLSY
jgi:hypothetical protein